MGDRKWPESDKHWCLVCKCWLSKKPSSIRFHESAGRHRHNVREQLKALRQKKFNDIRESREDNRTMRAIESKARAQLARDGIACKTAPQYGFRPPRRPIPPSAPISVLPLPSGSGAHESMSQRKSQEVDNSGEQNRSRSISRVNSNANAFRAPEKKSEWKTIEEILAATCDEDFLDEDEKEKESVHIPQYEVDENTGTGLWESVTIEEKPILNQCNYNGASNAKAKRLRQEVGCHTTDLDEELFNNMTSAYGISDYSNEQQTQANPAPEPRVKSEHTHTQTSSSLFKKRKKKSIKQNTRKTNMRMTR